MFHRTRFPQVAITVSALLVGSGSAAFGQDQQTVISAEALAVTSSAVAVASALGLTTVLPSAETVQTTEGLTSVTTAPDGSEVKVLVPTDQTRPVLAVDGSGMSIGIGVPRTAGTGPARIIEHAVVFPDQQSGFATTVQPLADGAVRTSVTIAGPNSPRQYRFPVSVGDGGSLALRDDGSVAVLHKLSYPGDAGSVITQTVVTSAIAPAWAVDAAGVAVPTHYSLEGNTLVQHVDLTATTAFPVVADPFWSVAWHVAKCAAAVVVAVASLAIPVSKLLKLKEFMHVVGGAKIAAGLLVGATSRAEKARVIGGAIGAGAAEILWIEAIVTNC